MNGKGKSKENVLQKSSICHKLIMTWWTWSGWPGSPGPGRRLQVPATPTVTSSVSLQNSTFISKYCGHNTTSIGIPKNVGCQGIPVHVYISIVEIKIPLHLQVEIQ